MRPCCEFHFDCIGSQGQAISSSLQLHQFISEGFGRCPVAQTFARRHVQAVANPPYISIWERQQSRVPSGSVAQFSRLVGLARAW